MTQLVDPAKIEQIVGATRHPVKHLAKADSEEQRVYILHSQQCLGSGIDLRDCPYSKSLDEHGIDPLNWAACEDRTVFLEIVGGVLLPLIPSTPSATDDGRPSDE